jgi:hypothetical protein
MSVSQSVSQLGLMLIYEIEKKASPNPAHHSPAHTQKKLLITFSYLLTDTHGTTFYSKLSLNYRRKRTQIFSWLCWQNVSSRFGQRKKAKL